MENWNDESYNIAIILFFEHKRFHSKWAIYFRLHSNEERNDIYSIWKVKIKYIKIRDIVHKMKRLTKNN